MLKSFKLFFPLLSLHSIPHNDRAKFCKFIKKEKLKYDTDISVQSLCCDT